MSNFPNLFSPITLADRRVRNRIVSAPMSFRGTEPRYTREAIEFYRNFAAGGAGIVEMGECGVDSRNDRCHPFIPHLDNPTILSTITQAIETIHLYGALASVELTHSGNRSHPGMIDPGAEIWGPSPMTNLYGAPVVEMTEEMMEETADKFAEAAFMAQYAGIDMIDLHLGHGWLLSQFLSPLDNHRTDKYGGSLENRARFPLMVVDRVRQKVGNKVILCVRISGEEAAEGGLTAEDSVELAKMLDDKVDLIHVSAATFHFTDTACRMFPTVFTPRGVNTPISAKIKAVCKHAKVAVVGALNTPELMEETLKEGRADFVVAGRAFLADPQWPQKALYGKEDTIIHCMRCTHCNSSGFIPHVPFASGVLRCSLNPTLGREVETTRRETAPTHLRKVLVAGGGPGGMEAALTAARRGHKVILCEAMDKLGANLYFADQIPFKDDLVMFRKGIIANVMQEENIEVRLNTPVDEALIKAEAPDVIIAACGALPVVPNIPGVDKPFVYPITDLFKKGVQTGEKVVIIGGGLSGCEEAIALADAGKQVTIVEMQPELAREAEFIHWKHMLRVIAQHPNITALCSTKVLSITDSGVSVENDGAQRELTADTVLVAVGMKANNEMLDTWSALVPELRVVGDCGRAGRIKEAMRSGYCAGYSID